MWDRGEREMKFKEGDYVKIIERDPTPADVKNGTYYPYFCGLSGTVDKVYDTEICLKVDPETLPEDVLKRHTDIQESIKRKWLNSLSGEARNRLTPEDKRFELAYTILVQSDDLEKSKPGTPKPTAVRGVRPLNPPSTAEDSDATETPAALKAAPAPTARSASGGGNKPADSTTKPVTSKDLDAAEQAFLKQREEAMKKN
jgi:hypothetical protein